MWLAYLARFPTLALRRRVFEHFLRTFDQAELHGTQWRAGGPAAYVGRQHVSVERDVERFDPETGEVHHDRVIELKHCPAEQAGGLAARSGRSPRTLNRYRESMRANGLIGSTQPPHDASDARRAANGKWAYAQLWLRFPPPPEMIARWRRWAKLRKKRPQRPQEPAAARRYAAYDDVEPPRVGDLLAIAAFAERRD